MAKPLLSLMGTPQKILAEAVPYMKAYFVGVPACLIYNFLAAALRSSGDTKRPLIFLASSGVLNVVLNLIMVLVFHMGAIGVGIATSAAQYASAIMILVYVMKMDGPCRVELRSIKVHRFELLDIIRTGLPAGIQSMVFSISNVLIQSSVNAYGDVVVSGNTAASNIESFIYTAMNAIYQSCLTFVGQHVGAGKHERIKKITVMAVVIVTVVGLLIGGLCYIFHEQLLEIYKPGDSELQMAIREAGARRMQIISTTYFLCGIMEVLSGTLRGMGKSLLPMGVSIIGSCMLRIMWIFTVCPLFPGNIQVLYLAWPVTWVVTSLGHLVFCIYAYKKMIRRRNRQREFDEPIRREKEAANV
jgi:putative MATE family efflux protein